MATRPKYTNAVLLSALARADWNFARAAALVGAQPTSMACMLRRRGIVRPTGKPGIPHRPPNTFVKGRGRVRMASHTIYVTGAEAERIRADALANGGNFFYTANHRRKIRPGDRVYFSEGGALVGYGEATKALASPEDHPGPAKAQPTVGFVWVPVR